VAARRPMPKPPRRYSAKSVRAVDLTGQPFERSRVRRTRDVLEYDRAHGPERVTLPGPASSRAPAGPARRTAPAAAKSGGGAGFVPTVKLDPSQVIDKRGVKYVPSGRVYGTLPSKPPGRPRRAS